MYSPMENEIVNFQIVLNSDNDLTALVKRAGLRVQQTRVRFPHKEQKLFRCFLSLLVD